MQVTSLGTECCEGIAMRIEKWWVHLSDSSQNRGASLGGGKGVSQRHSVASLKC
jgi:hypothetical protein